MNQHENDRLSFCRARWPRFAGMIWVVLMCAACGKKGPLYLPDDAPKKTAESAVAPASPLPQK